MSAADRVVRALVEEGPAPTYHRAELDRLRKGMPVLWDALVELARERGTELPGTAAYRNLGPTPRRGRR